MYSRRPVPASSRRGMSLVVVMAVLSTAVVVSVSFLQTQATALRATENIDATDRAHEAAEAGIAAAIDTMQDPAWSGISESLMAEVGRDDKGFWAYRVTFSAVTGDGTEADAATASLNVRIQSLGRWQPIGTVRPVERQVEAVVALTPRLPGRPLRPGDVAATDDRADESVGFDAAADYALFAPQGTDSLSLSAQTRVAGNVWLGERLQLTTGLTCTATQRSELLSGIGADFGGAVSPHPLSGNLTFYLAPDATTSDALSRLGVTWGTTSTRLPLPTIDPEQFATYQVFAGGPEYQAIDVGGLLQNVSLGPTDSNPLGIFYSSGNLSVRGNVVVRGTLVAAGAMSFDGRDICVTPFDWRDETGRDLVVDRNLWPVLPAVVAGGNVSVSASSRVFLEGTLLSAGELVVNTPDYGLENALLNGLDEFVSGATARPIGGGQSEVRIQPGLLSLLGQLGLTVTPQDAVRLNGPNGRWYPIVWANTLGGVFRVRGTADFPSPVNCWFQPRRLAELDVAGPVIASRVRFENPPAWINLASSTWNSKHSSWTSECALRQLLQLPKRTFRAYLADPANWLLAGNPYAAHGLPFEPTVRLTRPANVNYACGLPLFRPDPSARTAGGGYHWKVLSWRESAL